jgi:hypothetical protein
LQRSEYHEISDDCLDKPLMIKMIRLCLLSCMFGHSEINFQQAFRVGHQ